MCWAKQEKELLVSSVERFCMSVRDPRREPKVLYGCERPEVLSEKFCMSVRDPRCDLEGSMWV